MSLALVSDERNNDSINAPGVIDTIVNSVHEPIHVTDDNDNDDDHVFARRLSDELSRGTDEPMVHTADPITTNDTHTVAHTNPITDSSSSHSLHALMVTPSPHDRIDPTHAYDNGTANNFESDNGLAHTIDPYEPHSSHDMTLPIIQPVVDTPTISNPITKGSSTALHPDFIPPLTPLQPELRPDPISYSSHSTIELVQLLQSTLHVTIALSKAHQNALGLFKSKLAQFDDHLSRVLNLEMMADRIIELANHRLHSSSTNPLAQARLHEEMMWHELFGKRRWALSKPFGYSSEIQYRKLIAMIRHTPALLAHALAAFDWSTVSSNKNYIDNVARSITHDVFGQSSVANEIMTRCVVHTLRLIHAQSMQLSPSSFYLLEHNSFPSRLLQSFQLKLGRPFLMNTIGDLIQYVLLHDDCMDLNVDLMGASPRIGSVTGGDHDDDGDDTEKSHARERASSERLFEICGLMLDEILSKLQFIPYGIRVVARTLSQLTAQQQQTSPSSQSSPSSSFPSPSSPSDSAIFDTSSSRIVNDFIFLNWLVNAVMFPEMYQLTGSNPVSMLARRNLQAIGTVLIKLTSGSRFSAYAHHSQHTPLSHFLEQYQPRVAQFLRQLVMVDDTAMRMDHNQSELVTNSKSALGMIDATQLDPIALLPNDLYAFHGLIRCYLQHAKGLNNLQTPISTDQQSSDRNTNTVPGSKRTPSPLLDPVLIHDACECLVALGETVPAFVKNDENVYCVLDTGFPSLDMPPVASLRRMHPFNNLQLRHTADLLLHALSIIPPITRTEDLVSILNHEGHSLLLTDHVSIGAVLIETANAISTCTPSQYQTDEYRAMLEALVTSTNHHKQLLLNSPLPARLIHAQGLFESGVSELSTREHQAHTSYRSIQIRRLLELNRPKIRRLRKFLMTRSEPCLRRQVNHEYPSPPSSLLLTPLSIISHDRQHQHQHQHHHSPAMPSIPAPPSYCSPICPFDLSTDRFLCQSCVKLIDRRRGLVRSFLNKYIIGELGHDAHASMGHADSPINASRFAQVHSHQSTASSSAPSLPALAPVPISVGIGQPVDMRDPAVIAEVSDYVIISSYSELFVRCDRADNKWQSDSHSLSSLFSSFDTFYRFMYCHDKFGRDKSIAMLMRLMDQGHTIAPTVSTAGGGGDVQLDEKENALMNGLLVPFLGPDTLDASIRQLRKVDTMLSVREKLNCFVRCRSILLSVMHTTTLSMVRSRYSVKDEANMDGDLSDPCEPEAGTVEDFMSALSYVIMKSGAASLLSNIQFVRALYPQSLNVKGFVDACVAIKYLFGLCQVLQPIMPHKGTAATTTTLAPPSQALPLRRHSGSGVNTAAASSHVSGSHQQRLISTDVEHPSLATHTRPLFTDEAQGTATVSNPNPPPLSTGLHTPPRSRNSASHSHSQISESGQALIERAHQMGFNESDILSGLQLLSPLSYGSESSFTLLIDYLTTLGKLVDMGYPKHRLVQAMYELGLNRISVEKVIAHLENHTE